MTSAQLILAVLVICASVFALLCRLAPLGWQDSDGFHTGEQP